MALPKRPRAYCKVFVSGRDVTDRFDPYLIDVVIIDKELAVTEAHIELDDRYGILKLPDPSDPISIALGWTQEGTFTAFNGTLSDLESYAQKRTGRRLRIEAKAYDMFASGKAQLLDSIGDGEKDVSAKDALQKFLPPGMNLHIDQALGDVKRKYFAAHHESFMQFAKRVAKGINGVLKVDGSNVSITKADSYTDASGASIAPVICRVGDNVIAWRIRPVAARPDWKSVGHMHFDPNKAKWMRNAKDVSAGLMGNPTAQFTSFLPVADQGEGEKHAEASATWSMKHRGYGWTVIDGEPKAKSQGPANLYGYREGVDGTYRITEVEHHYSRGGFITRLDVDQPGAVGSVPDSIGD